MRHTPSFCLCLLASPTIAFLSTHHHHHQRSTRVTFLSASTDDDTVDIAIVGAGLGGLCAGAVLNTVYGKKVGIYESHYLAGGCAHAFDRQAANGETFTFDSGPTILLG